MPAHARAFVDALAARLSGTECQAVEAQIRKVKARRQSR
jgi:hypothetical protein